MNKIDFVTREVCRIVFDNSTDREFNCVWATDRLNAILFNTISGRHEIECFFAVEFEQEQVDAWTTVQNIIDDVMNLWVSPITDRMTDDFSKHPLSITEIKSDKTGNGSDWTVRDVLIAALRDLDSGKIQPDCCVVIVGTKHADGAVNTSFYQKSQNRYELRGLVVDFEHRLLINDLT